MQSEYEQVADAYEKLAQEPLVADALWISPFYEAARVGVLTDGSADWDEVRTDFEAEVASRTALVILALTYGLRGVRAAMRA